MKPVPRSARTSVALLGAATLFLAGVLPQAAADTEGPLNASDLELGDHTEDFSAGEFTVRANGSSDVTVSEHSREADTGEVFTQRLQLNGAGDAEGRSIQFDAEAGEAVTVHAQSAGGDEDRALALFDESWNTLDEVPAYRGDSGHVIPAETFQIEEAGTYWISSPSSGVNVYSVELGDSHDKPDRLPWDQVDAPVIEDITVDEETPAQLQVSYAGLIGADGGDLVRAYLTDHTDEVVDEQLWVSPGDAGIIGLTPPASGDYTVEVQLERHSEESSNLSEAVRYPDFVLPLQAPEVTSVLTTQVDGETATAAAQWNAVDEADEYSLNLRAGSEGGFDEADTVEGTEADLPGLQVGEDYALVVTAHRGDDAAASEAFLFSVAAEVQRWDTAHAGVGSGGEVTEHDDGSIEFDLLGNNSKIADSEDGFWYHYTEVDPQTENFTLNATFRVDDAEGKDNQSGFGIIAVDDFIPGDVSARYFNSAGTMAAKYEFGAEGEDGIRYGTPGGKYVHGYTGSPSQGGPDRNMSDSRAFDWEFKPDYSFGSNTNPPRFETGETYEFSLRRSNTGFHSIWHRDGEIEEVIYHDPDFLLTQNEESFYLGLFAARDIGVTVTEWSFETIHPEEDEAAEEAPTQYITPRLSSDVTSTTPHTEIEVPLVSTVHGEAVILDDQAEAVSDSVTLEPHAQELLNLSDLQPGANEFTAVLSPAEEQPQLAENQELESHEPVEISISFTVDSYGESGESLRVSPEGTPEGAGTPESPLDIHTAVAYAQPGQQIVLADGIYALEEAVRMERGNSGTPEEPITLMSEPGTRAVFDLSDSSGGGFIVRGDWWHLYNLEVTNSQPAQKPLLIQGHHNVAERIESHNNQDTGVQISGSATEPNSMWPSHNTVMSSVAHNNVDPQANDADGFAAKLTAGEGNIFRWNISYHNIDDGYDLYAKSTEGPIGTVLIDESVAFSNGWLEADEEVTLTSQGMGFKLGGESMPGDHLLRNSISYGNLANGITSNSGPNPQVENATTVYNGHVLPGTSGAGVNFYTNAETTDYRASGVLSFANDARDSFDLRNQDDESFLSDPTNYFNGHQAGGVDSLSTASVVQEPPAQVTEEWFVSTAYDEIRPEIADDGSIEMNSLFELTDLAPEGTGARMSVNPDPTELEVLPAVSISEEETGNGSDGGTDDEQDSAAHGGSNEGGDGRPGDGSGQADDGAADPDSGSAAASDGTEVGESEISSSPPGLAATGTSILLPLMLIIGLFTLGGLLVARMRQRDH